MKEVQVLDKNGVYLAPTTPANARRLIKSGEARVLSQEPFAISLISKDVPRPDNSRRIEKMSRTIVNVHDYFSKSRSVYIQNVSNPCGILSLDFKRPNGEIIPYKVPANRDPVCITNFVPFDAIKDSASFMAFLRPSGTSGAKLQLISEDDYTAHYKKKQELFGSDSIEDVIEAAQNSAAELNTDIPVNPLDLEPTEDITSKLAATLSPRVVAVCQQLGPNSVDKIKASEAITALESIELSTVDTAYILNEISSFTDKDSKIVKKWTSARQEEITEDSRDTDIIESTVNRTPVTI